MDDFFYIAGKWTFGILLVVAIIVISVWFASHDNEEW